MLVFRDYVDCLAILRPILAPTIAAITDNTEIPTQIIVSDNGAQGVKIYMIIPRILTALQIAEVDQTLFGYFLHIKKQAAVIKIAQKAYPIIWIVL